MSYSCSRSTPTFHKSLLEKSISHRIYENPNARCLVHRSAPSLLLVGNERALVVVLGTLTLGELHEVVSYLTLLDTEEWLTSTV